MAEVEQVFTIEELTEMHPTWNVDNVVWLSMVRQADAFRLRALLENECVKCHAPMGGHRFSVGRFICPMAHNI